MGAGGLGAGSQRIWKGLVQRTTWGGAQTQEVLGTPALEEQRRSAEDLDNGQSHCPATCWDGVLCADKGVDTENEPTSKTLMCFPETTGICPGHRRPAPPSPASLGGTERRAGTCSPTASAGVKPAVQRRPVFVV